jgi:hypothetical protein
LLYYGATFFFAAKFFSGKQRGNKKINSLPLRFNILFFIYSHLSRELIHKVSPFNILLIFTHETSLLIKSNACDFFAPFCGASCSFAPSQGAGFIFSCLHSQYCVPAPFKQLIRNIGTPFA